LVKETVFGGGNKFLWRATVIVIVGFFPAGQRNHSAVMKVVVPHSIQIVSAFAAWSHHPGLLAIVLSDQNN
jgi:hypothetical protein